MASDMCTRRLTRELRSIQKNPLTNPTVHTIPLDKNILEWHYVIEGHANTPYEGGYYWGKLVFPKEYPLKPPSVIMLTPNGRFKTGRRLCLSMSDFHPESWNPMWSVSTIITGLISFMAESSPTLGSIETSVNQKKKFARLSLEHNVKDATFVKLFPHLVTLHKEQLQKRRDMGERIGADGVGSSSHNSGAKDGNGGNGGGLVIGDGMQSILAIGTGFVALLSILFAMRFL
mmetsp:Transcript_16949/g.21447  ORF Transcript_16949/g.21447 Transcript_16949/m.21447 type:complete len:231 (-) Transcript_16949:165-857(-)|eukprot:CAMPEP_0203635474 /NCGR_PEP_ID=MMETSP0088-20131115/2250_1 /ASSEMBLY_ACC=CAM_ASM_001087 /TAXON_ID=426623 /ORGANISM="Chaetoceros affinis, Strain CCMP159" /LENGTH=230 /DNA_ID=CAMNT_0050489371 /DNA_START=36 /DNA_END=728 /DNA_ORIENTATION=+